MASGVDITVQILAKSKNQAAARLLEAAVKSSNDSMRKLAARNMIALRGSKGTAELIRHFDPSDEQAVEIVTDNRDKILPILRAAIAGKDVQLARNAFRIVYTQRFYEALPFLLTIFYEQGDSEESFLADGILRLLDKYVEAMDERKNRRFLFGTVLPEIASALEQGLRSYHRSDSDLFPLVYLHIYPYLNEEQEGLTQIVRTPMSAACTAIFKLLQDRRNPAIYRFIYYCLDNPSPPPIVLTTFAKRSDPAFLGAVLKMFEYPASPDMWANLAKLQRIEWLENVRGLLDHLDAGAQAGLVALIRNLDLSVGESMAMLVEIFRHGKVEGRLAALKALETYAGERVDRIIWEAAEDIEPEIQIEAITQLAKRDIPNVNSRILQLAESPHALVRNTVRLLLPNFSFSRFMESFDRMTDVQRRSMFRLVAKLDPLVLDELAKMIMLGTPVEKAKALLCIDYGDLVTKMEDSLCGILQDEEIPTIRVKAAELLADGRREFSRSTLVQSLHRDAAPEVRAAAKASLEKRPTYWNTGGNADRSTDKGDSPEDETPSSPKEP